jgi:hypothetical protein
MGMVTELVREEVLSSNVSQGRGEGGQVAARLAGRMVAE